MPITFGEAKKTVAQYAGKGGKCWDSDVTERFLRQVLEYLLISGQHGNLRKFTFKAVKGIFTAPYELEAPLKVKIDGEVGSSWDKWFEWYGYGDFSDSECIHANAILEEPSSPIVYDLPPGGSHVATLSYCEEDCDAHILVKGFDLTGRRIHSEHNGEPIVGEYLSIRKGVRVYTNNKFGKITEILKTKTSGYVQLLWVDPETNDCGFLADYSPLEQKPDYRRFKLNTRCADEVKISCLARIRLREYYTDTDQIPFDSLNNLEMAAQALNAKYNKDVAGFQAMDGSLRDFISRENEIKRVQTGQPIEVFKPLSGGSVKNIVGGQGRFPTAGLRGPTFWGGRR